MLDVKAIGKPLDGLKDYWWVGIRNPDYLTSQNDVESYSETLFISNLSVVTSGDYERFFTVEGKNYHHIIDKLTLYPAQYFRALTVVHEDSGVADFLSTALFMLPIEDGIKLVNSIDGAECLWIKYDGSKVNTKGLEKYMLSKGASGKNK